MCWGGGRGALIESRLRFQELTVQHAASSAEPGFRFYSLLCLCIRGRAIEGLWVCRVCRVVSLWACGFEG